MQGKVINNIKLFSFLAVISFMLSACGGGGGGALPATAPPDKIGPVILSIEPALNEIDMPIDTTRITLTFNETLIKESILPNNILIQEVDSSGNVIPGITVALIKLNPLNYIDATNKLIITTVTKAFKENREYQIKITNLSDSSGNSMLPFTSRFSTTKLPVAVITNPVNDVIGTIPVSISQKITVEFDEVMDDVSLRAGFTLTEKLANSTSSVIYKFTDSNSSLTIDHQIVDSKSIVSYSMVKPGTQITSFFAKTARYTVNLLAAMTDLKGNKLTPDSITFVTGVSDQTGTTATKPGKVSVISTNDTVTFKNTVSWPIVNNTAYNIYVSKNGGDYIQVTTTPTPLLLASFVEQVVTAGTRYKYAVTAMNIIKSGVYGPESLFSFSGEVIPSLAPTPKNLIAIAGPNGTVGEGVVKVTWDAVANNKYNLYESVNGSAFSILLSNTSALFHSYTPASGNDNVYQLGLTIQFPDNTESAMLQSSKVVPFGALSKVTAVGGDKKVTVTWPTWKNVAGVSYSVYVKQGTGAFSTTPIATNLVTGAFIHGGGVSGSTNPPLLNGISYTYGVTTESTIPNNRTSLPTLSNITKTIKPRLPPIAPVNINASAGDASVSLSWEIAVGFNYDYHILQQAGNETTFTEVALLKTPTVGKITVAVANNINYVFQIAAIDNNVEGARATTTIVVPRLKGNRIDAWDHSCVIKAGDIWCWGSNTEGQLGNATKTKTYAEKQQKVAIPTTGRVGTSWVAVATGFGHTCGIRNTGDMYCWGAARAGQLGIGPVSSTTPTIMPQLVKTPVALIVEPASGNQNVNWTQVSAGNGFTCGIHSNAAVRGQLFCWGANSNNNLGVAQSTTSTTFERLPVPVLLGGDRENNWVEIQAGSRHTCGIRQQLVGSTLWCWGLRSSGQSGDGIANIAPNSIPEPNQVVSTSGATAADTDWSSVALGRDHTCAVRGTSNTLWCWGSNVAGQLTIQPGTVYAPAQESSLATDWVKVFANNNQTCGLKKSGAISCWGKNLSGEAGNGTLLSKDSGPTTFAGTSDWSGIAVGLQHACAINTLESATPNAVSCWGNAEKFALGTFTSESAKPLQIGTATNWLDLTAGLDWSSFIIGIRDISLNNNMYSWGSNSNGNLGNSNLNLIQEQLPVVEKNGFSWKELSAGRFTTCGIKTDSTLYCWGKNRYLPLSPYNPYDSSITGVTAIPTQIGAATWLHVNSGLRHACGIKTDNSLWCWGRGKKGALGAGIDLTATVNPEIKPDVANGIYLIEVVKPDPVIKWTNVSAGYNYTCAIGLINAVSNLYCWGSNVDGQLGIGTNTNVTDANGKVLVNNLKKYIPTLVTKPTGVTTWLKIATGYTTCAITDNGIQNLYCWGDNFTNAVGSTTTQTQVLAPLAVTNLAKSWADVSVTGSHACARQSDNVNDATSGTLWCWGQNDFGQLGNGTINYIDPLIGDATPRQIFIGNLNKTTYWKKFTTGVDSTCAIRSDNTLWCWGRNFNGQLGTGNAWRTSAIPLTFP